MNDLSKRNLVAEAEALEVRACDHESAAKNLTVSAERCRAEAAKLREAAREPREWFLDMRGDVVWAVHNRQCYCERPPIRVREVRPVRITDEQMQVALRRWCSGDSIRAVMAYALSLAGVEVEK